MFGNVLTAEKLREKTAVGFETGNWQPLMLELEAMVLSGYAIGIAMGVFSSILLTIASVLSLPAASAIIGAIILTSIVTSFIDAELADKINKNLIPSAQ